jgi:hypothetical protein
LIEVLSEHFRGWSEKNHEISVKICGIVAEIRTDEPSNTNIERYNYTNFLGLMCIGKRNLYVSM